MKKQPDKKAASRKLRPDGNEARDRLLLAGLQLFASKGFAKTSVREIALAANVNLAAISYYFSDKAGLYRAVFTEPLGRPEDVIALYDQQEFSLRQSLYGFFTRILAPMKQGDLVQLCTRLHFREMLEPTGVWTEKIDNGIKPIHGALIAVIRRHLGLRGVDNDLHRLVFSITGMAMQIFVTRDVIDVIRPNLLASPKAIDQWVAQLVDYAEAIVAAESKRRGRSAKQKNQTNQTNQTKQIKIAS